jgi:glyoxylase-like metal-dependent hydrolase (beta-lactamase superfamily II)
MMRRDTFAVGPLGCNCTLLVDEAAGEALVVDPGGHPEKILERLGGVKVKAIVITHAHIDHLCGIPEVQAATGAPVLLHEQDRMLYDNVAMQAQMLGLDAPRLPEFEPRLANDVSVRFGAHEAGVLFTPGHTPGSCCFHLGSEKLVLTGDTLFRGSIGRTDLWGGDYDTLIHSIRERLLALPDDTVVIPGHGAATRVGDERERNPFLQ